MSATKSKSFYVKLPNAGGHESDIRKAMKEHMQLYFNRWETDPIVTCLPPISRCDWEGQTGTGAFPGLDTDEAKLVSKDHLVVKYVTETTVLKSLLEYLSNLQSRTLVLHGPELSGDLIALLSQYLERELDISDPFEKVQHEAAPKDGVRASSKWSHELTDILIFNERFGICIVEVKPSLNEFSKAHKELSNAAKWIEQLLSSILGDKHGINIIKLMALPKTAGSETSDRRTGYQYLFRDAIANPEETPIIWNEVPNLAGAMYSFLALTFALLKTAKIGKGEKLVNLTKHSAYEIKSQILSTITSQGFLEKNYKIQQKYADPRYKPDREKKAAAREKKQLDQVAATGTDVESVLTEQLDGMELYVRNRLPSQEEDSSSQSSSIRSREIAIQPLESALFNEVLFLNPEQSAVWDNPVRTQFISGYAATGKTVLVQNKAIDCLRNSEKVFVIIPSCIHSFYREYFKRNCKNFDELIASKALLIGNLKEVIQQSQLSDYNIFLDELNVMQRECTSEDIEGAVHKFKMLIEDSERVFLLWIAFDDCQCFDTAPIESAGMASPGATKIILAATLVLLIRNYGSIKKLTTALRCTYEVYKEWDKMLQSKLLRLGHNVHGDSGNYFSLNLDLSKFKGANEMEKKFQALAEVLHETIVAHLVEGWQPWQIAVIFNSSWTTIAPLDQMLSLLAESEYAIGIASERFTDVDLRRIVVDLPMNFVSHEWPVIIEVDDPRCLYIPSIQRYVVRSRALVRLMGYSLVRPGLDPNRPITLPDVLKYGNLADVLGYIGNVSGHCAVLINEIQEFFEVVLWRDFQEAALTMSKRSSAFIEFYKHVVPMFWEHLQTAINLLNFFHECCYIIYNQFRALDKDAVPVLQYTANEYRRLLKLWLKCRTLHEENGLKYDDKLVADLQVSKPLLDQCEHCLDDEWFKKWQEQFSETTSLA